MARNSFFAAGALCDLVFRLLTALAFFLAARRTFFAFTLRFKTIRPPMSRPVSARLGETVHCSKSQNFQGVCHSTAACFDCKNLAKTSGGLARILLELQLQRGHFRDQPGVSLVLVPAELTLL